MRDDHSAVTAAKFARVVEGVSHGYWQCRLYRKQHTRQGFVLWLLQHTYLFGAVMHTPGYEGIYACV